MKVELDCLPCFLKQTVIALRLAGVDGDLQRAVVQAVLDDMKVMDMTKSPAHVTTFLHRTIRDCIGRDPYADKKRECNALAMALYGELKSRVTAADDPLRTAALIAVAGNVIDFGIYSSFDVAATIERALSRGLAVDDYQALRRAVQTHSQVLYLIDNAGEIVFDRLLIEEIERLGRGVTAVVKGLPVLNDATMADAREAGLTGICSVIDNGCDCVGTILEYATPQFNRVFDAATLVISKGQGNFETLLSLGEKGRGKEIFFLFQAKCDVVSRALGVAPGAMLLSHSSNYKNL
jgi:hypothetical protein